ncbi:hypothetical protein [Ralstonia pickettii]|uniref:hypothetical protein n=1 Tax=Ralstonia pickettii TaxID=329 RepID=UPI00117F4008|nr:hypothetical protein [Ralstonia pickettii]
MAIPSIPLRQVEVRGNMVHVPYPTVRTDLKKLVNENGEGVPLPRTRFDSASHPFDNLEAAMGLRKRDVFRWGNGGILTSGKKKNRSSASTVEAFQAHFRGHVLALHRPVRHAEKNAVE